MKRLKITYSAIIERCKMLSAFEGQTLVDGNGESRYGEIRLTEREHALMIGYIEQGVDLAEATLGRGVEIVMREGTTSANGEVKSKAERSMEECLASYVMHLWLENKEVTRSGAYKQMFVDMLDSAKRLVYRKGEPDWDESEETDGTVADATETGAGSSADAQVTGAGVVEVVYG